MTVSPHQVFYLIIEVIRNNKVIVSFSISYTNLKGKKKQKKSRNRIWNVTALGTLFGVNQYTFLL
jgi:hypothetical protein